MLTHRLLLSSGGGGGIIRRRPRLITSFNNLVTKTQRCKSTFVASTTNDNDAQTKMKIPDFNNYHISYESKSIYELIRSILVLRICRIQWLVQNSNVLLKWSENYLLGKTITNYILQKSLFEHFCGGTSEDNIRPVITQLREHGIGGILDYAAEQASEEEESGENDSSSSSNSNEQPIIVSARVYDYESETKCDEHVKTFLSCIHAVKNVTPEGFAALKITALGNPLLLEKLSTCINEGKKLFSKFDTNNDGIISKDEFIQGYKHFFVDAETTLPRILEYLHYNNNNNDNDGNDGIDYITWSKLLKPQDLPRITSRCREKGPLAMSSPSDEEIDLMNIMHKRAHLLANEAYECNVRLLIDAEQQKYQPAIDNLVLELQKKYNSVNNNNNKTTDIDTTTTTRPIIFNTYQCYLKDSLYRLQTDVKRCERYSYHFGAKLVRGAYMNYERDLATKLGVTSPIHDTINDTHQCYDGSVDFLLRHALLSSKKNNNKYEVMLATHNQSSIENAINVMNEIQNNNNVSDNNKLSLIFAQLYGMADNLTYNLGHNGYQCYKYVPYGKVEEVMPYLIRRAHENSSIMSNTTYEIQMMTNELKRRLTSSLLPFSS